MIIVPSIDSESIFYINKEGFCVCVCVKSFFWSSLVVGCFGVIGRVTICPKFPSVKSDRKDVIIECKAFPRDPLFLKILSLMAVATSI